MLIDPTRDEIVQAMEQIKSAIVAHKKSKDPTQCNNVFIYFSGHGSSYRNHT